LERITTYKAIIIASGGLSGGISSSIAEGNFWTGTRQGLITSGLNHSFHWVGDSFKEALDDSAPPPSKSEKVVDSNLSAINHYFNGEGKSVELGTQTKRAVLRNKDTRRVVKTLIAGDAENLTSNFSVDLTKEVFHVGRTRVDYSTSCTVEKCTTNFTAFSGDGFRDPLDIGQVIERVTGWKIYVEIQGGIPYNYIPWNFSMSYKNPGYLVNN
jgi:hypothetical protein